MAAEEPTNVVPIDAPAMEPEPPPISLMAPPVPQLGLPTDKNTLDVQFGQIALSVRRTFNDILSSKGRLDGMTEQDLLDRGYTTEQIAQLRSAWADLHKLVQVFYGEVEGGPVYDYSTFVKFLWGFGV